MDIEQLAGARLHSYEIESLLGRGVIEGWLPEKTGIMSPDYTVSLSFGYIVS